MFGPAVAAGPGAFEGLAADEVERFREFLGVCVGEAPARVTAEGGPVAGNVRVELVAVVFDSWQVGLAVWCVTEPATELGHGGVAVAGGSADPEGSGDRRVVSAWVDGEVGG